MNEKCVVINSYRENFASVLSSPLKLYNGIVLLELEPIEPDEIEQLLQKYGVIGTQKYLNHIHMLPYASDLSTQRKWSIELIDRIRANVKKHWDHYAVIGEMRDDGFDIEVTFWTVER